MSSHKNRVGGILSLFFLTLVPISKRGLHEDLSLGAGRQPRSTTKYTMECNSKAFLRKLITSFRNSEQTDSLFFQGISLALGDCEVCRKKR
jgi:hypothetical protein